MVNKSPTSEQKTSAIVLVVVLLIPWFGLSYVFGGGLSGLGNAAFVLGNLLFSLWLSYKLLAKLAGLTSLNDVASAVGCVIFIVAAIPYIIIQYFNPFID